ncbi:hypothetical protein DWB68_15775 [Galactobacter valiniphilus]|uniref:Deoxyribonuclease NucA/NucB domain-containing protein n=1 Tax=Galactobacter valiniphilus TaxID=2676122 RepID=A0A399J613_9MICC|nr:hypothetical protein [Galactobacter valiniphilus]RII40851.1 hypothetical protein DWB68_15775 [Galactobacter valiniphilus]
MSAIIPSSCRYPAAIKSGAKGYSICRIPASQNSYQGGKLSSMYKRDRVLVGDRYYARVTK